MRGFSLRKKYFAIFRKSKVVSITFRMRQIYEQNVKEIDPLEPKCDEPLLERLRLKIYPYFVDNPPPLAWEDCSVNPCPTQYKWHVEDWGDCSKSCGGGIQRRKKICTGKDMISTSWKLCKEEPPITRKRYGNDNLIISLL